MRDGRRIGFRGGSCVAPVRKGEFTPIDYAGATWTQAVDVNSEGDIIGLYADVDGNSHMFAIARRLHTY